MEGSMTMEWAREVVIGISGRREGVQGPVVMMMVEAGRVRGEESEGESEVGV
jgi:hypothetical protein